MILPYLLSIIVGLCLGLVGGGGSILTVPVLVYLLGIDPIIATTYSLFIVGCTSFVGGIKAYRNHLVDFKAVSLFGIPSILSVFIARHFILPKIPWQIAMIGENIITRDGLLMIVFTILMLAASISMITRGEEKPDPADRSGASGVKLLIPGLLIGLVTGLLGAGGGFLIIPALVFLLKTPMKTAIGTSLLIIAINSLFGFVFSLNQFYFDWKLLIPFTLMAIIGVFIGSWAATKISASNLKKGFGWFVLALSIYILCKEIFFKN